MVKSQLDTDIVNDDVNEISVYRWISAKSADAMPSANGFFAIYVTSIH